MNKKKRKLKVKRIIALIIVIILIIIGIILLFKKDNKIKEKLMINLVNEDISSAKEYANDNDLKLNITYEYSDEVVKDKVISQNVKENTKLEEISTIDIVVSLGKLNKEQLKEDKINELGTVPIMMYHGIREKRTTDTGTVGGNVDKDGYTRTPEAYREDLEFYYEKGYRMIRLEDYVNGKIDVAYGYSPIIITFDDGNANNIKVTGLDSNGNIIIDENSAVGILEAFKKKKRIGFFGSLRETLSQIPFKGLYPTSSGRKVP